MRCPSSPYDLCHRRRAVQPAVGRPLLQHAGFAAPVASTIPARPSRPSGAGLRPHPLDLNMPGTTGFDVMEEIGEATRRVPSSSSPPRGDRNPAAGAAGRRPGFPRQTLRSAGLQARVGNLFALRQMYLELQEHSRGLEARVEGAHPRPRASFEELRSARQTAIRRLANGRIPRQRNQLPHRPHEQDRRRDRAATTACRADDCKSSLDAASMHDIGKIAIPTRFCANPAASPRPSSGHEAAHPDRRQPPRRRRVGAAGRPETPWAITKTGTAAATPRPARRRHTLFGRIAAVADVFDALNMARPQAGVDHGRRRG